MSFNILFILLVSNSLSSVCSNNSSTWQNSKKYEKLSLGVFSSNFSVGVFLHRFFWQSTEMFSIIYINNNLFNLYQTRNILHKECHSFFFNITSSQISRVSEICIRNRHKLMRKLYVLQCIFTALGDKKES